MVVDMLSISSISVYYNNTFIVNLNAFFSEPALFRRFAYLQRECLKHNHFIKHHFHSAVSFQMFSWMQFLSMALPSYGSGLDSRQNLFSALPLQMCEKRYANGKIRFPAHLCFSASRTCSGNDSSTNRSTNNSLQAKSPRKEKEGKNISLAHAPPNTFSVSHVRSKTISGTGASIPSSEMASDAPCVERATMTKANKTRFSRAKDEGGEGTPLSLTHPNPDIALCHTTS